jgi:DNA-binding response OmpR family regulator
MVAKVLVVEDTLDTREILHLYLTNAGFTVITASDGREGLYMARAEKPDLIVTDLNMPHVDGISLVRELRAQSEFKDLPIIVITAFGKQDRDEAIKAGANRAVDKPIDLESLIDDINGLLKERTL